MRRHEIIDTKWKKLVHLLPSERKSQEGPPEKDNRMVVNAILFWPNTGITWRDLLECFNNLSHKR